MTPPLTVAVVAFTGFNELDVLANLHILNRVTRTRPTLELVARLVGPAPTLRSMYDLDVTVQAPLDSVADADAVVIGSGGTLAAIDNPEIMTALGRIDPGVQIVASQCSGALVLHRLGLLGDRPACTDDRFRPVLEAAGVTVLDQPFVAHGNVATTGGCLASAHLSAWMLSRLVDPTAAADTLATIAPVGHQQQFVADVMKASPKKGRRRDRPYDRTCQHPRRPRRHPDRHRWRSPSPIRRPLPHDRSTHTQQLVSRSACSPTGEQIETGTARLTGHRLKHHPQGMRLVSRGWSRVSGRGSAAMAEANGRSWLMSTAILPLAVTMMAGPQEMTAIIFVTHPTPRRASLAFLTGVTVAMVSGTTIYYLLAGTVDLGDPSDTGSTGTILQLALAGILALLALRTYRHRETIDPPKWLGGMMQASPQKALMMGFLLTFVMPTDIASMVTVGTNLQHNSNSLIDALPFWGLTLLIAALPILSYLIFGKQAEATMPKIRDWMYANSWLVNIIVLGIFILLILG